MKKVLILCLFAFCFASAAKKSLAVMPCVGDFDAKGLERLRNKIEEVTRAVLPSADFRMIPYKNVQEEIGDEALFNACKEGGVCFGDLAGKVNADYGAWCMVNKYSNKLIFTFQLYSVSEKDLIHTKEYDSYNPKNVDDMIEIIKKEVPIAISEKIPGVKISKTPFPAIAGGISGVQTTGGSYELEGGKRYLINLSTEPAGAVLSFNGVPDSRCSKTPCKIELSAGNVRIIANLEQYEITDTTVSIKQNNQSINIKLKANFGVLEIKPAYSDGIGKDKQWNLSINDKPYSLGEVRLSPNKYKVKLNHECYEDISFDVGINKDKHEIFDMASKIALKKGGLDLSVERNGEPASEPVFVNGKQVGETPFSGSVPLCAKIEIGKNKEVVGVKLKYNENVKHTHKGTESQEGKYLTDSRDGKKYKIVKIGTQTWMAENLNYNAKGSKCYDNQESNCQKYGRLYNWKTAVNAACPEGWHLPSNGEWNALMATVSTNRAGTFLKATSGWKNNGNGEDKYGFSALPGGSGDSFYENGHFDKATEIGSWWSSDGSDDGYSDNRADYWTMYSFTQNVSNIDAYTRYLFSVRCIKDYENVEYTHEGTDKPSISVDSSIEGTDKPSISADSSMSVEFSKPNRLKFGIGGAFDQLSFRDNVNFDNPNIEATRLIGDAFSLGVVMSIPFINLLTFNPEFYLVYRTIINDYECSTICRIEIKEFAINIPLIVSLEFAGETDNNIRVGGYIETGASLDIPLSTSVNSNPEIYVDREKLNSSVVFGAGFILGDFYLGVRGNIGITFFDKNAGGKFNSRIFIARYFF